MKKKSGLNKAVDVVPFSELEDLHTGTLLARLKQLRWCMEDPSHARDYTAEELQSVQDKIVFKSDPKWKAAYAEVKCVLDKREHLDNRPK